MEEKRLIQPPFFRRCCSTPEFASLGGADETENSHLKVYVVARPFQEYGGALVQRLPEDFKELALQIGVCHFMTVFKTNGGDLYQFDFGPQGGRDIQTNGGPLSCILEGETTSSGQKEKHHPGEIREQKVCSTTALQDVSRDYFFLIKGSRWSRDYKTVPSPHCLEMLESTGIPDLCADINRKYIESSLFSTVNDSPLCKYVYWAVKFAN